MALLFSSGRQYLEAIEACNSGLLENPQHFGYLNVLIFLNYLNFSLLLTKAKLFCALNQYSDAFSTYLKIVQHNFDESQFSAMIFDASEPNSHTLRPSFLYLYCFYFF